jgi:hypothetical protein
MLLRRVTEHVRDQNWFAVFIDFLIVVIGVFIGIQVANWNAQRLAAEEEQAIVQRLAIEFREVQRQVSREIDSEMARLDRLVNLISFIDSGEPATMQLSEASQALIEMPYQRPPPSMPATLTELLATGRLWRISDSEVRRELQSYRDRHEVMIRQWAHLADDMRLLTNKVTLASVVYVPSPKQFSEAVEEVAWVTKSERALFWDKVAAPEVIDTDLDALRSNSETRTALARAYDNRRARLSWQLGLSDHAAEVATLLDKQRSVE